MENERDEIFDVAASLIVSSQIGSTALLQRKLKIGYMRACRIMQQLEIAGIVGEFNNAAPRKVLIKTQAELINIIHA